MTAGAPSWSLLLRAAHGTVAWPAVLGGAAMAVAVGALLVVLPATADGVLPVLAVAVLAGALGAAADDVTADVTAASPVTARRRWAARVALTVPVSALGLAGVLGVAAAAGAAPGWDLVALWAVLGALALAAGAVGHRAGAPGAVAATTLLGAGLVLHAMLPAAVLEAAPWDSTGERVVLGLAAAAAGLAWGTRDPGARWVRGARGRRPARPPAAASR
ncbi:MULTISPECIES: hypothetical protein [unclassified Blastococcus]